MNQTRPTPSHATELEKSRLPPSGSFGPPFDASILMFLVCSCDETKLEHGAGSILDKVEREDEDIVESVQIGIKSRFYKHGRYSPKMEKGVHHFHRLISEFIDQH